MSSTTPKYAAKSTIRTLKNFSKGYTEIQAKVRTATSNDPWGPSGTQMNELARATFGEQDFLEIMEILDKRMNDKGKNWRHVFKALTVLDYLLHVGSENVVKYAQENVYIVKTLKEFQYIDEDGKDQGSNVRQKAKDITALLSDETRLREERRSRTAMRDRMSGRAPGEDRYEAHTPVYERPGAGDDDRELQRALEESRRMAREAEGHNSDDDDLKKALALSEKEEADRLKNVEKYNELSMTEDWEGKASGANQYQQQQDNTDFFANDFGSPNNNNNNNNNFDAFSPINNNNGFDQAFLQQQPTGFNNPYLQFQQQQLQQQQIMQQQMMQQQLQQQQLQQQQQMAFMMNNPYQQQLMPQMTGAPTIGSNNPFSALAQQKTNNSQPFDAFQHYGQTGKQLGNNNSNGSAFGNGNSNGSNSNNNNNGLNSLGDLAFLQASMSNPTPAVSQPQSQPQITPAVKAPNAHDEKYAHLAMALSNRDDGMDTFGNTGQLRIPSHHVFGGVAPNPTGSNPFGRPNNNNSANGNSLIDVGDSNSNNNTMRNNPFQAASQGGYNSGFMASQPTGFGGNNNNANGAYSSNTLF